MCLVASSQLKTVASDARITFSSLNRLLLQYFINQISVLRREDIQSQFCCDQHAQPEVSECQYSAALSVDKGIMGDEAIHVIVRYLGKLEQLVLCKLST